MNLTIKSLFKSDDIQATPNPAQILVTNSSLMSRIISNNTVNLQLDSLKMVILDYMDEMRMRDYQKDSIYKCMDNIPDNVQIILLCSKMPSHTATFITKYTSSPIEIADKRELEKIALDNVKNYYVAVEREEYKLATLLDSFESIPLKQTIIFCNFRR